MSNAKVDEDFEIIDSTSPSKEKNSDRDVKNEPEIITKEEAVKAEKDLKDKEVKLEKTNTNPLSESNEKSAKSDNPKTGTLLTQSESTTSSATAVTSNTNTNAPANVKNLSLPEQVEYYKNLCLKTKKLAAFLDNENKELKGEKQRLLNKIQSLNDNLKACGLEEGMTFKVLFKFQYQSSCFYFFTRDGSYYFLSDKVVDEEIKKLINEDEKIRTFDFKKDIEDKDETLRQVILQYDERIQRLRQELETTEKKVHFSNEKMKKQILEREEIKVNSELERKKIEQSIKEVIQLTSDITLQMKNMTEVDLSDENLKVEVFKNQESVIQGIGSNIEDCSWVMELRSHFIKILTDFLRIINKHVTLENNFHYNKLKFQQTSDKIALIHEEELGKKVKLIEAAKLENLNLKTKISNLESEKYNLLRQKDQTIDILNKELNKGVNVGFLKNILLSFLTSDDESIQQKLIPVIFTALQFSDTEMKKVNEYRNSKKSSLMSYFSFK